MRYKNRIDAGNQLATSMIHYHRHPRTVVLALPRGGVPVAYAVCRQLQLPLDIFVVRKLGVPGREEVAMGALASGGIRVLNRDIIEQLHISDESIALAAASEQNELERRESLYRGKNFLPDLTGRTVLLVDDGIASGASMSAAVMAIKSLGVQRLVVAVPVAPREVYDFFEREVDEFICVYSPHPFHAVGAWYEDFSQTSDEEVKEYLRLSAQGLPVN